MKFGKTLVLASLGGAFALAGCDEDLINPMAARQPKVNAYAVSDFFEDGLAMRQPPAGTVPRQRITGNRAVTTGRNGETYVTQIPIPVDDALLRLGRKRYDITCGTCHGPVGDGDSIVARQMGLRPPPSLHLYADRPPGYIYEVITNGFGLMASYAAELPVRDRWAVVAYVRALQISQAAPLDRAPADERARLEKEAP
jgi:mono/diheme cytochrome c family protein